MITNAIITESPLNDRSLHVNMDKADKNMHYPKGFRDAILGGVLSKNEVAGVEYFPLALLPACEFVESANDGYPGTAVEGETYILYPDAVSEEVDSIEWQSGTTVRYYFGVGANLSDVSTDRVMYIFGDTLTNTEHYGRYVVTAWDNTNKWVEISNPLITDATKDESSISGVTAEFPYKTWNGASNGDWVRADENGNFYRINPVNGQQCYNKTTGTLLTFQDKFWRGAKQVIQFAASDETTALSVANGVVKFRMPFAMEATDLRASLNEAGTTSGITTIDINKNGTSIISTKITVDLTEKTSVTAATPFAFAQPINNLLDDDEISVDVDAISGGGTEAGLKIAIIGYLL